MSSRFFLWFFAVFTTSLESQAINEAEGARALFIAAARDLVFLRPPEAWRARLRMGLGTGLCSCASSYLSLTAGCAAMASK